MCVCVCTLQSSPAITGKTIALYAMNNRGDDVGDCGGGGGGANQNTHEKEKAAKF